MNDQAKPRKLSFELVPTPLWGKSLKRTLPQSEWDRIRKTVYRRQQHKCGICGASGMLYCHEQWEYDDEEHTQTLTGFLAVCELCNRCVHFGRTGTLKSERKISEQQYNATIEHYMKVNGCSRQDFEKDLNTAYFTHMVRSREQSWRQIIGDYNTLL